MFSPASFSLPVGDSVKVTNQDSTHHTFTKSGVFDSGDLAQNATYTERFTKAGKYDFLCTYHSSVMKGTLTVTS